ncbi:hypothetical protein Kisp01_02410 [Kineosporia sp. NBRC 101677]|uniref:hypothetical protein n=1 Tax=Kineosporia sp. NBRC 101677 TaxID=3032197 RepID=UPI00249FBCB1|nr:hypothetical protein [Kineosporia sp. NBRC 101677]GLY13225.1 hypothetical protein Kisp01_02410 [Kineosporia sp. NBRC 101677]
MHLVRQEWPEVYPDEVCAVVVPASRPSHNLTAAVALAEALGCPLVVACSGRANVQDVARELDGWQGVAFAVPEEPPTAVRRMRTRRLALESRQWARPVPAVAGHRVGDPQTSLSFRTMDVGQDESSSLATAVAGDQAPYLDAGTKRNVALLLSRQLGWRRLLFLDDDIQPPSAEEITRAVSMLGPGGASMASWPAHEFPDNSVVCHARRTVGLKQDTFLAGGCLLVDLTRPLPFFPAVYNEDWLFCWEAVRDRRMALPGAVDQQPYNPFDPRRAAREEFGDVLGEGLFALLHQSPADLLLGLVGQGPVADRARIVDPAYQPGYWAQVIEGRQALHAEVMARLAALARFTPAARQQLEAVRAGQERLGRITPQELAGFVALWQEDLATWRYELAQLHRQDSYKAALNQLGIDEFQRVGVM